MVGKKWLSIKRISVIGEIPDIKEFQGWNLKEKLSFISHRKTNIFFSLESDELGADS